MIAYIGQLLIAFGIADIPAATQTPSPVNYGRFPAAAQTEWLDDGRRMFLLRDFVFEEPNGVKWVAKAAHVPPREGDLVIDGATIPPVFWSIIGGPYEGLYRNGSVVHDAECTKPYKHRWQDVHRMLYRASRAGGTSDVKAKLIFAAVWHFGPRWPWQDEPFSPRVLDRIGDATRLVAYILKNPSISLADIEALSSDKLLQAIPPDQYNRYRDSLETCNDPNGPYLGARGDVVGEHEFRRTMSTPPEPCMGRE